MVLLLVSDGGNRIKCNILISRRYPERMCKVNMYEDRCGESCVEAAHVVNGSPNVVSWQ